MATTAQGTSPSPDPQAQEAHLHQVLAANPLQADDTPPDNNDSLYSEGGSASYETSLRSSVLNYKYENGRRYHAFREGSYLVPNDEEEQDRMDLGHHIYRLSLGGKLYMAPIGSNPQRVLDLGTGTGIWAMDFAEEFPSAQVLGTDLSPIQPKWVPPNCTFEVDDYEEDWVYHTPFDFIHGREIEGCIGNEEKLFQQSFQHLASGGYIEMQGIYAQFKSDDGTLEKAQDAQLWMKNICEGAAKFGKPLDTAPGWKDKLIEAGFVDVQQEIRKIPIGPWPKDPKLREIGTCQSFQELQVVDSYTPGIFGRVLGWSDEEIKVLIAKVKKDLKDPAIHLYLPVYFVWGRKP
ncbi:Demethylmenaquinone methyltransferase [Pleurostoma richardsiae]|uniref:Demethylmenaquinone methyltransferase n=1 Tax=Pleurostoma richardsiae TaxID=41990 RepID=A0AA38VSI5_9PEZI|nr:Demethylmenaquinone methyltransferase [Pleurostoma richardsiae]